MSQETTTNNQPVHRLRIGRIGAAIFENRNSDGYLFYNVQFDRSYRDGNDWKHTRNFGRDDLLILAKLSDQAHSWITDRQSANGDSEANGN
ncbi:MAG: hypothetical protein R3C19_12090 [Planctomycetaceae bacterium]